MGKATVVSGGTLGSYQIKLDYGKALRDAKVTKIDARVVAIGPELTTAQAALDAHTDSLVPLRLAVDDAIAAFEVASRAVPRVAATVAAALQQYTKTQTVLLEAQQKGAPLRLALDILKEEKAQLLRDRAYWAALVLEETVQAWCADLTETAAGAVATIEIPGENKSVLIAPNAPAPTAADGALLAREMASPEQCFFNAAILPGWQKHMPTYRRGTITAVNAGSDKANVTLEASDKSSAQKLNINQQATLVDVPVEYMTCNAAAFEVGDKCVIKFKDRDWAQPRVVGFVDNPKACGLVLSGVVKDGEVVTLAVPPDSPPGTVGNKVLRSYRPTFNAWKYVLREDPARSPDDFNDEPRLAKAGTQYADLSPSMFSGLMAKAAQVLMGMGKEVGYDYRASRCHGITTDDNGGLWLVEISAANGVIARRLPLTVLPNNEAETNDAIKACYATFKGLPTGQSFPVGDALTVALASGEVVQLCSVADMAPYFSKLAYHADLGWSFSDTGDVAYNTCYEMNEDGSVVSYLFKITFTLNDAGKLAVLETVEYGELNTSFPYSSSIRFTFDGLYPVPSRALAPYSPDPEGSAPILACHINGELDVVRCVTTRISSSPEFDPPYPEPAEFGGGYEYFPLTYTWYYGKTGGKRVGGTHLQNQKNPNASVVTGTRIMFDTMQSEPDPKPMFVTKAVYEEVRPESIYVGMLFWARGCRDGYARLSKDEGGVSHTSYRGEFAAKTLNDVYPGSVTITGYPTNFVPNTPVADYVPGYDGPPDGDGYDFIQYGYAGDTYPPLLFFKRTDIVTKETMGIVTREGGVNEYADVSDLGDYADAYGRLTYNAFGPTPHSAFTVPAYSYTPGASPTPVEAGGSRLVGPMLEAEAGSIDHTYTFIGYIQ